MARPFDLPTQEYSHNVITKYYRAPEILMAARYYNTAIDLWSVGCIFAEMVAKKVLFPGLTDIHMVRLIFGMFGVPSPSPSLCGQSGPGEFHETEFLPHFPNHTPMTLASVVPGLPPMGLELLQKLLMVKPTVRITARAAKRHEYFQNMV
eukprot:TRINITY_DN455_c0_g1_i2.p1 TRINITY_DN455_c0_g1~~TRINITY_DN455_c0_g1_i2.p1  ORF type:complete len:150 (-),score=21.25 TRINITY_DN455_c0_g1_i2:721-1170(-)